MPARTQSTGAVAAPRRGRWLRRILFSVATSGVVLFATVTSLTCRPGWYRPAAIDFASLDADRNALADLENRISAALNARQPVRFEITQEQANRWLTARGELWLDDPLPELAALESPFIEFRDGSVRLAAMVRARGLRTIASCVLAATADAQTMRIEWRGLRLGALPIPAMLIRNAAQNLGDHPEAKRLLGPEGVLEVPNEFTWPNGKRRMRVAEIAFADGRMTVHLEPY